MRVPDDILKTVVFVGLNTSFPDPQVRFQMVGTAFFASVPSVSRPDLWYTYLVTAAHVAEVIDGDRRAAARLNSPQGRSVYAGMGSGRWWFHPADPYADVAVFPLSVETDRYEHRHVPIALAVTDEVIARQGIGIGDDVVVVGLFSKVTGDSMVLPIARTGNIAMMPPASERIRTGWTPKRSVSAEGTMEGYLIEARSIGGLSGSPVYCVRMVLENRPSKEGRATTEAHMVGKSYLLGLVHGHWDLPVDAQRLLQPAGIAGDARNDGESVNMGIAIVTPAKKLVETLYQPQLVKDRERMDAEADGKSAPIPHRPTEL